MKAKVLSPGTTIYRVVDPKSVDNNICWMSKEEFDKLTSKSEWRRRFAVWVYWNGNGQYVTYTVPPGQNLHVWEGVAASQTMKGTPYVLEGGATQIVLDPGDLRKEFLGKRQPTSWGYNDFPDQNTLIGVPDLTNNWIGK